MIRNVSVLPMDAERTLSNQSVLIDDGVIVAMGPSGLFSGSDDTTVIEGAGKYLMPGLSDMHAHIAGYADDYEQEAAAGISISENQLLMYLASGVTLLRDTAGSEQHFDMQQRLKDNQWLGPELYFTSLILEGEQAVWDSSHKVLTPEAVDPLIAGYAHRGYWGVKVYHTLSAAVFDEIIAAGERHQIPIIGHVPFEVGIDDALQSGMLTIEHLRGYDFDGMQAEALFADGGRSRERFSSITRMSDERMADLVAQTVANGVWNCPTLAMGRFLYDADARAALTVDPRYPMVHPDLRASVENSSSLDEIFSPDAKAALKESSPHSLELTRRLHDAGAGLLIGTDSVIPAWVPGFTPIDEMQEIASSGISNYEVLRMATVNAADVLGLSADRGTIAVGKQASFILLDADPSSDLGALWKLSGVMHNGVWLTQQALEAQLRLQMESFSDAS
ncbi:MAG: amidohydrolase family protein [Chromatocurvus sp.]